MPKCVSTTCLQWHCESISASSNSYWRTQLHWPAKWKSPTQLELYMEHTSPRRLCYKTDLHKVLALQCYSNKLSSRQLSWVKRWRRWWNGEEFMPREICEHVSYGQAILFYEQLSISFLFKWSRHICSHKCAVQGCKIRYDLYVCKWVRDGGLGRGRTYERDTKYMCIPFPWPPPSHVEDAAYWVMMSLLMFIKWTILFVTLEFKHVVI